MNIKSNSQRKIVPVAILCIVVLSMVCNSSATARQDIEDIDTVETSVTDCQTSVANLQKLLDSVISTVSTTSTSPTSTVSTISNPPTVTVSTSTISNPPTVTVSTISNPPTVTVSTSTISNPPTVTVSTSTISNPPTVTVSTSTISNPPTTTPTISTSPTTTVSTTSTTIEITTTDPSGTGSDNKQKRNLIFLFDSDVTDRKVRHRLWQTSTLLVLEMMDQILNKIDRELTNTNNANLLDDQNDIMDSLVYYGNQNKDVVMNSEEQLISNQAMITHKIAEKTLGNLQRAMRDAEDRKHKTTVIASSVSAVIIVLLIVVGLSYCISNKLCYWQTKDKKPSLTLLTEAENPKFKGVENITFQHNDVVPIAVNKNIATPKVHSDPISVVSDNKPTISRIVADRQVKERYQQYPPASSSSQKLPRLSSENRRNPTSSSR